MITWTQSFLQAFYEYGRNKAVSSGGLWVFSPSIASSSSRLVSNSPSFSFRALDCQQSQSRFQELYERGDNQPMLGTNPDPPVSSHITMAKSLIPQKIPRQSIVIPCWSCQSFVSVCVAISRGTSSHSFHLRYPSWCKACFNSGPLLDYPQISYGTERLMYSWAGTFSWSYSFLEWIPGWNLTSCW